MIEVIAEILRGPVFLAGETLSCQITLTNKLSNENDSSYDKRIKLTLILVFISIS